MANKPLKTIQFPGLSDTYTIPTKVTDLSNDANYATTSAVSSAIASAIGGINSFDVAVVTALPTQDIKDHTIYFVAKESETNDVYDEFMYIDSSWEKIGNTAVDLDGYATESYVDTAVASVSAAIPNVYSWALASSKPTYTYSEVGAMSAETIIPAAQINSDWLASTGVESVLNKPAIYASNGEDSLVQGTPGPMGDDAAIYTIYVSGKESPLSYTTQDTLPSKSSLKNYGLYWDAQNEVFYSILDIDTTNQTISINDSYESTISNREIKIYYKYKLADAEGFVSNRAIFATSYAHAEGFLSKALKVGSHAEGYATQADGFYSHAEGNYTRSNGTYSHAEGGSTQANGIYSHAEGGHTATNSTYSHAEGFYTQVSGTGGHAEGHYTNANGYYSHAEGEYTTATHLSQHVFGEYNSLDSSSATAANRGTYVEIVGNGTAEDSRSNARTLDWSGNETLAGTLTLGAAPTTDMQAATKSYVDMAISSNAVQSVIITPDFSSGQRIADISVDGAVTSIYISDGIGLPAVTSADNDKVLTVVEGAWAAQSAGSGLPAVTSSDNGKVLTVISGEWIAQDPLEYTGIVNTMPVYDGGVS